MALMLFLGIGLYLNSTSKKEKIWSLVYTLLMYSNWLGCRSRAGFLGAGVVFIFVILLFHKLIKTYKKELMVLLTSFVIVFIVMNTVKTEDQGSLSQKYTNFSVSKTDLRDAFVENGALVIRDKNTNIKVFQKDGKVQFYDEGNKVLLPKIIKHKFTKENSEGQKAEFQVNKIVFVDEKYKRFSFNLLDQGVMELEYVQDENNKIKYPIFFVGNSYKSPGITGKLFDIVKIPRWQALDGYGRLGSSRGYIWALSLPLLRDTMFLGYGPDTFSIVFPQNDTFGKTLYFTANTVVDKPHNMYLQIAVNTGVISMFVFIVALFIFLLDGIVKYRSLTKLPVESFLWMGVLAYHATGMFNDSLVSVAPIAWIYFGLSAGSIYNSLEKDKTLD